MAARNEVFDFLNALRESGKINMMGDQAVLEQQFQFTPEEAKMNFFQ